MKSATLSPLTTASALNSTPAPPHEDATSRAQKAQAKRLSDMQSAVAKLRAMPSSKASAKRVATERVNMLKRRLDMMKQMLIGASPEVAKAIAAQIRSIAKELAGIAKTMTDSSGGGGGSITSSSSGTADAANASATPQATAESASDATNSDAAAVGQAVVASTVGAIEKTGDNEEKDDPLSADQRQGLAAYAAQTGQVSSDKQASQHEKDDDKAASKALKEALSEAMKTLRELIALLKSKTGKSKKAAEDIQETEARLNEIAASIAKADHQEANTLSLGSQSAESVSATETLTDVAVPDVAASVAISVADAGIGSQAGIDVTA